MQPNKYTFFLVIPIGFNNIGKTELINKWSLYFPDENIPSYELQHGGIELHTSLDYGHALNKILKVPSKILLRIDKFKCRDFPKLFKKVSKLNWSSYLIGQMPIIKVSTHNSRLIHSGRIEDTVVKAINKYYKGMPASKDNISKIPSIPKTVVHIRVVDDECTLSINTSGERLNIRNKRILVGVAPLRENLAAALLIYLQSFIKKEENTEKILIDPMCGTGVFLLEAATLNSKNIDRQFSYESFPLSNPTLKLPEINTSFFDSFLGVDINSDMVAITKENLKKFDATIQVCDVFHKKEFILHGKQNFVIVNPPYGKRINIKGDKNVFFQELLNTIEFNYSPELIGIILPEKKFKNQSKSYHLKTKLNFSNGGYPVCFYIYSKIDK